MTKDIWKDPDYSRSAVIRALLDIIEKGPDESEKHGLAIAMAKLGRFEEAHDVAISVKRLESRRWLLQEVADCFKSDNDNYERAHVVFALRGKLKAARLVAKLFKPLVYFAFLQIYKISGDRKDLELAKRYIQKEGLYRGDEEVWIEVAEASKTPKDLERAREMVRKSVARNPEHYEDAAKLYVKLFQASKDPTDAGIARSLIRKSEGRSIIELWSELYKLTGDKRDLRQIKMAHRRVMKNEKKSLDKRLVAAIELGDSQAVDYLVSLALSLTPSSEKRTELLCEMLDQLHKDKKKKGGRD